MSDQYIPHHILVDIFVRLPFKSLFRFKCVSKSWRDLIDGNYVTGMHYARTSQIETYPHPDSMIIIFGAYKQLYAFNSVVKKGKGAGFHRFLGSYDGILCLSKNKGWNNDLILWNPFTRSYFELPFAPDEFKDVHPTSDSFVYDHINDDYKVVRWFGCSDIYEANERLGIHRYNLCVFSLKQKSWKPIRGGIPFELPADYFFDTYGGGSTTNCVHWLVSVWSFIIGFDFGTYKFRKLSFKNLPPKAGRYIGLGCLDGCLSLVCHYDRNRGYNSYKPAKFGCMDIWVMKEYVD